MTTEYRTPTPEEIAEFERKAHALRAQVMRDGFVALYRGVAALPHRLAVALRPTAHS